MYFGMKEEEGGLKNNFLSNELFWKKLFLEYWNKVDSSIRY